MNLRLVLSLLIGVVGVATTAAAQEAPGRPWTLQADFGFVNTAGNTSTITLNAGQEVGYTRGRWTLGQNFAAVYGRTSGQTTTESYRAGLRSDLVLTDRLGWYLLGGWEKNEPGGIERRFEEGTGVFWDALPTDRRTRLRLEAGAAATQQRPVAGGEHTFASGRAALVFRQDLTEHAFLRQMVEVQPNLQDSEDLRINTETSLVAPLSTHLALKAGYVVRFDNQPEPGKESADRYLTSGLSIVF